MSIDTSTTGDGRVHVLVTGGKYQAASNDISPTEARALAAALIQLATVAEG